MSTGTSTGSMGTAGTVLSGASTGANASTGGTVTGGSRTLNVETSVDGNQGFSYRISNNELSQLPEVDRSSAVAYMDNGAALPAWLTFDRSTLTFTAGKVPAGALPMTVRVEFTGRNGVKDIIRVFVKKQL